MVMRFLTHMTLIWYLYYSELPGMTPNTIANARSSGTHRPILAHIYPKDTKRHSVKRKTIGTFNQTGAVVYNHHTASPLPTDSR